MLPQPISVRSGFANVFDMNRVVFFVPDSAKARFKSYVCGTAKVVTFQNTLYSALSICAFCSLSE
jgi:hypothetical protein